MSQDPSQPYQKPPPFSSSKPFPRHSSVSRQYFFSLIERLHSIVFSPSDALYVQTQPAQREPLLLSLKSSSDNHHLHPQTLFFSEKISVSAQASKSGYPGQGPSCHFCPAVALQIAVLRQLTQET